jgi:gamma-glutamylputrescine oxidase
MLEIPYKTSYWFDHVATAPSLERDDIADIVIIGGGYAGLSSALNLKQAAPQLRITLIESNHIGYGSSGRNAGWLSAFPPLHWLADDLANKSMLEDFRFATAFGNTSIRTLGLAFQSPEKQHSWVDTRHYLLARNVLERATIRWLRSRVEACGIPCEIKENSSDSIANYPHLAAMSWPTTLINPYDLVRYLREQCIECGVSIFENTPIASIHSAKDSVLLKTQSGVTMKAEKVILATNAYSSRILMEEKLPTASVMHTYMIATEPLDSDVIRAISASKVPFGDPAMAYFCGRFHNNRFLFNGKDRSSKVTDRDDRHAGSYEKLYAEMIRRFPALSSARIESAWGGAFMETPAESPIIRPSVTNPNIILNIGYGGGSGIGLALQSGRLTTDIVLGEKSHDTDARHLRMILNGRRFPVMGYPRAFAGVLRHMRRISPQS